MEFTFSDSNTRTDLENKQNVSNPKKMFSLVFYSIFSKTPNLGVSHTFKNNYKPKCLTPMALNMASYIPMIT